MTLLKSVLLLILAIGFAVSPFLNPEFGGFDPDRYPIPQIDPPAQPAGYAFAIWGPIYLYFLVHAGFGLVKRWDDPAWDAPRWPLILSLGVGVFWLPVALLSPLWATVMIWAMLATALEALRRASRRDRWLLMAPIGLYAGWLTAASAVSVALVGAGWGIVLGPVAWAAVALLIALMIGAVVLLRVQPAPEYGAAIIWALIAVAVANIGGSTLVLALAVLGAAVLTAVTWKAQNQAR